MAFDTEARVGEKLRQSTFPIIINEPGGAFNKPNIIEMLKSSIESTVSRGRFEGRSYKNILSLAPVVFASNKSLPVDDAIFRRMEIISFSHKERKNKEETANFEDTFHMENTQNCRLHGLKPLSHFFVKEIIVNPDLLDMDWKELANTLLIRAYGEVGRIAPGWLLGWYDVETLEDLDDLEVERVRIFLQKEINRAYGRMEVLDEEGYPRKKHDDDMYLKSPKDLKTVSGLF